MLLSSYHLRGHISWSSRCVFLILRRINPCDSHISESEIALGVKNEILRFDITMNDVILVQILETQYDTAYKKLDNMLGKPLMFSKLKAKITPRHIIHDEIKIGSILESKDHIH